MKIFFALLFIFATTHSFALKADETLPKNLFVELAKKVNPAVVNINTTTRPKFQRGFGPRGGFGGGFGGDPFSDFFEQFMYGGNMGQPQAQQSLGTGFIIEKNGLILTNNHVVDGADEIRVQLNEHDKKTFPAKVIGRDRQFDVALIKIESPTELPTVELGSSDKTEVGEWVAAFGNPYGHGHTMTKGIISAKNRELDDINAFPFLQTDASINPGNSGGPLVNSDGKVIGVNTAIDARAQGIGFAIPIDSVKNILPQLKKGKIQRGYLGVLIDNLTPHAANQLGLKEPKGVLITQVLPDSPAEKAGIKEYDVITQFGQKEVLNSQNLMNAIAATPVDSQVSIELVRNGKKMTVNAKLVENPGEKKLAEKARPTKPKKESNTDIGLKVGDMTEEMAQEMGVPFKKAPVITEVQPGSAAAQAGLIPGDVILDVNRQAVRSAADVQKLLQAQNNVLRVQRGNAILVVFLASK